MHNNIRDAEFCGKVPLHQTNLVQPHGWLMVLDNTTLDILQASENIDSLLGVPVEEAVKLSLSAYISYEEKEELVALVKASPFEKFPFRFNLAGGFFEGTIRSHEGYLVAEIETTNEDSGQQADSYQMLRSVINAIRETKSLAETCEVAAKELQTFSGFDKVMVYRFDENWNGDVVAESKTDALESYLGLKFPASDIPAQARALYQKTIYRLIPNVNYEPVKLYPVINPKTNMFTDLSDSNLRSVANVHLEYLRNMKIEASMSTRLLVNGKLWGIISCHHRTPRYLSSRMRYGFELLSGILSSKLEADINREHFEEKEKGIRLHQSIIEDIYKKGGLSVSDNLLTLLNSEGVSLVIDGRIDSVGKAPAKDLIASLVLWLQSSSADAAYFESSLSTVYEPAMEFTDIASGLLVLPLHTNPGSFILGYRPEASIKINWGGNPNEVLNFEPGGKYHPRASFALWRQDVAKTAVSWTPGELEQAENFRNSIIAFLKNK